MAQSNISYNASIGIIAIFSIMFPPSDKLQSDNIQHRPLKFQYWFSGAKIHNEDGLPTREPCGKTGKFKINSTDF